MASFIVDAAGYATSALAFCQVAPFARSVITIPMDPGRCRM